MTEKQKYAIKVLNDIKGHYQLQAHGFQMSLDMAIKALSQEPCDDAISRQAAIDTIRRIGMCKCSTNEIEAIDECRRAVEALPSVSTEKTGRWKATESDDMEILWYSCSVCGTENDEKDNFCPFCGCRMVEPQESEDKE